MKSLIHTSRYLNEEVLKHVSTNGIRKENYYSLIYTIISKLANDSISLFSNESFMNLSFVKNNDNDIYQEYAYINLTELLMVKNMIEEMVEDGLSYNNGINAYTLLKYHPFSECTVVVKCENNKAYITAKDDDAGLFVVDKEGNRTVKEIEFITNIGTFIGAGEYKDYYEFLDNLRISMPGDEITFLYDPNLCDMYFDVENMADLDNVNKQSPESFVEMLRKSILDRFSYKNISSSDIRISYEIRS